MKYIKYFESKEDKVYYSVDNEERRLRKELEKINCPIKFIDALVDRAENFNVDGYKTLFVFVDKYRRKNGSWWIGPYAASFKDFKYQGPIRLTKEELDDIKMIENTEKYNL